MLTGAAVVCADQIGTQPARRCRQMQALMRLHWTNGQYATVLHKAQLLRLDLTAVPVVG